MTRKRLDRYISSAVGKAIGKAQLSWGGDPIAEDWIRLQTKIEIEIRRALIDAGLYRDAISVRELSDERRERLVEKYAGEIAAGVMSDPDPVLTWKDGEHQWTWEEWVVNRAEDLADEIINRYKRGTNGTDETTDSAG